MQDNIKKHEKLKICSIYSYMKNNNKLPNGYDLIGLSENINTDFSACVIKTENSIIIAFRGSDSAKDFYKSNKDMLLSNMPEQAKDAINLYNRVKANYPNAEIILTGHSLGGSLAQIVGAVNNVETVTFNAYGTKNLFKPKMEIYPDKITNYVNLDDYEIITRNTKNQIGTCYSVGTKGFAKGTHELEDMADLSTRELFDQTRYGKPDRHPSQGPKEIHTLKKSDCTGLYSVSGYVREDGTKVDSYTRTCYVHNGNVIKIYAGKKYNEMSQSEQNQFLEDNI